MFRDRLYEIIFEADTKAGKRFDVLLLIAIIISVLSVALESIEEIESQFGTELNRIQWFFTILFTIEYGLRIISVKKPLDYIFSFFGLIDLFSLLPGYFGLWHFPLHSLIVLRILRIQRVFWIFKMVDFTKESQVLGQAMRASKEKIIVFLVAVLCVSVIMGTVMYLVEGPENGFTSIPRGIYWAIVTMTTVGYGDLTPVTPVGQAIASLIMILGYGIIAVPTGIVTSEITRAAAAQEHSTQVCSHCMEGGHEMDSKFCKYCGGKL